MPEPRIEQALYAGRGPDGYELRARSAGFLDEWGPEAERLCAGFGARPAGARCPAGIFAQPFGRRQIAVVQVADLDAGGTAEPAGLGFRFLILQRAAYVSLMADPFVIADRFPPPWQERRELPALEWPAEPLPRRTVAEVQQVLQRPDGPTLLGGVQALVDGGRLVFERPVADTGLIRGLWTLLPTSNRRERWPASFAFGNELGFDALVVPHISGDGYAGYVGEEQAEYYPQGRYELSLQIAAEAGDQAELDRLFARRSRAQTWRLGLVLLALMLALALLARVFSPQPRAKPQPPPPAGEVNKTGQP